MVSLNSLKPAEAFTIEWLTETVQMFWLMGAQDNSEWVYIQWLKKLVHIWQFLLGRSIAAQRTKVKSWEILVTKQGILSLSVPSFKPLASFTDLIQDLQWPTLDEPVFVLWCGLSLFGLHYCLYPSGHALNQVSTNLLCTLSDPTFTYSKAHVHHQEGPHKHWTLAWGIDTETQ